jgi:hypothetical protein
MISLMESDLDELGESRGSRSNGAGTYLNDGDVVDFEANCEPGANVNVHVHRILVGIDVNMHFSIPSSSSSGGAEVQCLPPFTVNVYHNHLIDPLPHANRVIVRLSAHARLNSCEIDYYVNSDTDLCNGS